MVAPKVSAGLMRPTLPELRENYRIEVSYQMRYRNLCLSKDRSKLEPLADKAMEEVVQLVQLVQLVAHIIINNSNHRFSREVEDYLDQVLEQPILVYLAGVAEASVEDLEDEAMPLAAVVSLASLLNQLTSNHSLSSSNSSNNLNSNSNRNRNHKHNHSNNRTSNLTSVATIITWVDLEEALVKVMGSDRQT